MMILLLINHQGKKIRYEKIACQFRVQEIANEDSGKPVRFIAIELNMSDASFSRMLQKISNIDHNIRLKS